MADSRLDLIIKARDEASAILKKIQGELGGIDKQSATASRGLDGMRDSLASIGAISSVAFVGIAAGLKTTIDAYSQAQSSQLGFEATAKKLKVPIDNLNIAAQKLSADGLIPLSTAQAGMQNLMQAGLTDVDKITKLMQNFKDEAVFGKSASIDLATAVSNLSESYKTESSSLGNLSGISENYSMVLERGAKQLGKRVVDLTEAERAEAKYLGLLEIGAVSAGNSALAAESLSGAQAKANTAFREAQIAIGEALAPALASLLSAVTPIIQKVTEWVEKNPELVAQMAGLALGVTGLGVAMGALSVLMTPAVLAFGKFLLIATAVAGAAAIIREAYETNFMGLQTTLDTTAAKLQEFYNMAVEKTQQAITAINTWWAQVAPTVLPIMQEILAVGQATFDGLGQVIQTVYDNMIAPVFNAFKSLIGETFVQQWGVIEEAGRTFQAWWSGVIKPTLDALMFAWETDFMGIRTIIQTTFDFITSFIGAQMELVLGILKSAMQFATGVMKSALMLLRGDWKGAWDNMLMTLGTVWNTIVSTLKGFLDTLLGFVGTSTDGIVQAFANGWNSVMGTVGDWWNNMASFFTGLYSTMVGFGENIIKGLIDGMKNMAGAAVSMASNIASSVSRSVSGFFGIHSPSRLMYGFGENIVQGLANGIQDTAGLAVGAMSDLVKPMAAPVVTSTERNIGGGAVATGGTVVNNYISQMIGDEQYAEKLGDMIVKNLAYSTAF